MQGLRELDGAFTGLPIRHWLSFKTQPLRPLIQWRRKQNRGVEVVSEFEFLAALKENYSPENILINGPAKHRWLPKYPARNISVNFDSSAEAAALLPYAKKFNWRVGIRFNTFQEFDPESPDIKTQFGFGADEAIDVLRKLKSARLRLEVAHFHLRTNISTPAIYEKAVAEVADICAAARFAPRYFDLGGGFPVDHVLARDGHPVNRHFKLAAMRELYKRVLKKFPGTDEIWLENGRWLSARSGVLAVKILDSKQRDEMRNLICDGGRTMNAMLSTWEQHELFSIPDRRGKTTLTTVNGPTCMAFDQLARRPMPRSLRVGDILVWLDAGAYHLSWETRFSHGNAAVFWHDGAHTRRVRRAESFDHWWSQWS